MKRVDVVYALICKEDEKKVLMVNNRVGGWSLPGGKVEREETLEQAVVRETKEETGLTVEVEKIVAVNEAFFTEWEHHALFITFKVKVIAGDSLMPKDRDEILEIQWVDLHTANELMPYHPGGAEALLKSSSPYTFQGRT